MKFSLIICTYQRPKAIKKLMQSLQDQTLYPDEIIIIDGSHDNKTQKLFEEKKYQNTKYYKVKNKDRGLTRQRNFGIKQINPNHNIVCFLDDDVILTYNYFEELINTYKKNQKVDAVGGYIINENNNWEDADEKRKFDYFYIDGYKRKLSSRFVIRKLLGLFPDQPPGFMPDFSHGLSVGFLPPSGKIYPVEFFMGGVSSYKKNILEEFKFSTYFEGYGLYEDMDYCLRISKKYNLAVNTNAQLYHYHEPSGRPNYFRYGTMVIRNGWYVWRVKYPKPSLKARFKWNATAILLATLRLLNVFSKKKRQGAFTEAIGRYIALMKLFWNKPTIQS